MLFRKIKKKLFDIESSIDSCKEKMSANEILSLKELITQKQERNVQKDSFLLFHYNGHIPRFSHSNLGDYNQTIATKNALDSIFSNIKYKFHDRDSLVSYSWGGDKIIPVIMQGWFAETHHFIPNNETLPIFVGTHFTPSIYRFLQLFINYFPSFFENKTIGCRDFETLRFCKNLGLNAYLSRCLTLTLPKRKKEIIGDTIYLVGCDNNILSYIPKELKENAQSINQQWVKHESYEQWQTTYERSKNLIDTYKEKAKLVITCALHCAAPCVAMGIPVVLIAKNQENINRFSAVKGILPIYTMEDLKANRVDFSPKSLDIEELKQNMLENLKLSIQQEMGEEIDLEKLYQIRKKIEAFNIIDVINPICEGGGEFKSKKIENTWKNNFNYDIEFKQRSQILLNLFSKEVRSNLTSVLDLGCGIQYFKEVLNENGLAPYYVGVDLYPHKEDNILCDFNNNEFPKFSKETFDLIVCAGLFEYIVDLQSFINKICALSPKYILCSYNFEGISAQNKIWVNRLNQMNFFKLFLQNSYYLNSYKTHQRENPTGYFLFCKKEMMGK